MVGRLVVASVLLGVTLFVAVDPARGFDASTPRLLLLLIGATFAVSLACAVWLPRTAQPRAVAGVQLAWDVLLVTGLVYVSGASTSVFTFLYGITILLAAIVVGPRVTQAVAVTSILVYVVLGTSVANGWLPPPPDQEPSRYLLDTEQLGFALMSNVVGLTVVTLLAANLASRLRRAGGELRRAEESVASLARLNDDIVRSMTAGLVTADLDGAVRTANPAAAAMFGTDAGTLVGRPLGTLLPLEPGTPPEGGERAEGTATRVDGTGFPVGYTRTALVGPDGRTNGLLVTFQDLSEIVGLREAAERAERLATLGRLAAGLAHEIRNPLSSISGSVQLVRESHVDDEDRKLLGIVLGEVERLDDLVATMLHVGRPRAPVRADRDLGALVADVVAVARAGPATPAGVRIDCTLPDGAVTASIDADQVRQVVWNLLKNALQVSDEGGTVYVAVREDAGHAVVEVRDEGRGIDEAKRERLFETFYSSRDHGVGLGLALVKQIVDQHAGTVEVESTPGRGATFRVSFPRA
jgi:two-component system sensor histidine kinase PilS (NtrC family)